MTTTGNGEFKTPFISKNWIIGLLCAIAGFSIVAAINEHLRANELVAERQAAVLQDVATLKVEYSGVERTLVRIENTLDQNATILRELYAKSGDHR